MKKSFTSSVFLVGLFALSLACYVYLHKAAAENSLAQTKIESKAAADEEKETLVLLPDLAFVVKVLNISKIALQKD